MLKKCIRFAWVLLMLASFLAQAEENHDTSLSARGTMAITLPGWESELVGFRSYGAFTLDPFARHVDHPGLYLRDFFDEQNQPIYDYHHASNLGMDILHIGPTLGLAGIGLAVGDQMRLPLEGAIQARVVSSGPLRAVVEMTKPDWTNTWGTFRIQRTASIEAGYAHTEIRDVVKAVALESEPVDIGLGLKKVEGMQRARMLDGRLILQWHKQDEDIGEVGLGLLLEHPPLRVVEDADQTLFVWGTFDQPGQVITNHAVVFVAWRNGGAIPSWEAFQKACKWVGTEGITLPMASP